MSAASSSAAIPATDAGAGFQLGDLVRVIHERRSIIRNVAIVTVALTLIVVMILPTVYSSSASVMLDTRKNNVADLSSVLSALPTDPASLQNQIQILTSRDLALQVIGKLGLYDDPEFNPALKQGASNLLGTALDPRSWLRGNDPDRADASSQRDQIVNAFLKHLSAEAEGLSTTLTVSFTSRDPEKAALIANTLVDTYVEDQVTAKRDAGQRTTQWLVDRTRQLAQQVQDQEAAVQRYKAENNLTDAPDGTSLTDQQISATSNQLVLARADLAEKQATNDRVKSLVKEGDTADVSQILASPLIVQLRTQQATLISQESELSTRYGPRHPKLEAVETQKRDLDSKIATEVSRLAGSISNDVSVARAQVGSLQGSLSQAERQAQAQNLVRVKLRALQSNAQSTRTMYEAFVTRLRETQDQADIQNPDARVISHAPVPTAPSSPHRLTILAASIPAGLLLGLLMALLAERLSAPVPVPVRPGMSVRPAQAYRPPPVLAEFDGAFDPRAADFVIDWPNSTFSHATAALLNTALAASGRRGGKVITVTSPEGGPAKTAIAVALARVGARGRLRVAMIDGDLRRPSTAQAMGLGPVRYGLLELLTGTVPLSRSFCRDPRSTALLLSVGRPANNPGAVLASAKMAELVAHLRRTCDVVIIDAPALFAGREARSLARLSDAVLVVARAETARQPALWQPINPQGAARATPIGLVIVR